MLRGIIALSLHFRVLIVGVAAAVIAVGIAQLGRAPLDVFPEFTPPQVQIQSEALGLSAAEVEQLVTVPLEQDLLNGIAWLDQIRSESVPGLSSIDLIFKPGTNILQARQAVQERLTQAYALPAVGSPPVMIQPLSSTSRAMMIGLSAKDLSLIDLSVLARWKIKPRLMGIPGVASVSIWGQRDRQLQVQVDSDKLRRYGISLNQVLTTTGNALWVSSLSFVEASTPGTGGFIDTSNQRLGIQHVLPITTATDLGSVSVEDTGGRTLRLGEVANVVEDHQPLIGDAVLSNGPGLMLVIEKFPEANTREVTKAVEDAMNTLRPGLSGVRIDTNVYRPATFIQTALDNLGQWVFISLIGIAILLGLWFLSWRVGLISLVAITLSLVAAMLVLYLRGTTFNMMTLAGIVVALGVVIDDAVVDVDRIRHRLRARRASGEEITPAAAVLDAVFSVRRPVLYATLIVLLAPLPLVFLSGVAGAFAGPLVLSYVLAVAASTVVGLTVTPALAVMLLSGTSVRHRTSPFVNWLHRGFDRATHRYQGRSRWMYLTLGLLAAVGLAIIPHLGGGQSLIPSPQDRDLLVQWQTAPGTSLQEMSRITTAATKELRGIPGVADVGAHLGRALQSDQVVNVNSGELWVSLAGSADYDSTVNAVRRTVDGYPGMRADVLTYQTDRVRAAEAGGSGPLTVRVYGQDLDVLRTTANQVRQLLTTVPGVVSPAVQTQPAEPTLAVEVNLDAAQRYGIKPGDVRRAAATYFSGLAVGSIYQDQKIFDVVVQGAAATRNAPTSVADLLIDTPSGERVRLGDVATVRVTSYPTVIRHEATSRSLDVTATVSGRGLDAVIGDINSRLAHQPMPLEYHAEVLSGATDQQNQVLLVVGIALAVLLGVFLLLQAAFSSWRLAVLVLLLLPLAGTGGVLTGVGAGGMLSLGALIGLLAILGIAARNIVLLVHGYQHGERGPEESLADVVVRTTRDRVAPVVLTALTLMLAVLPLVLFGGIAGLEVLHPLAVVVLGGLVTSTLLTLFLLPALYLRFAPGARQDRPNEASIPAPADI